MFVLVLIGVPVVEVFAFIEVGRAIGWLLAVVLLLGTSVLGARLLRIQGRSAVERVGPFLEADLATQRVAGHVVREPTDADLRALLPLIQQRLPTLAAVGDLTDFLFVEDLVMEPARLVPKRWDAATTLDGLTAE